MRINLPPVYVLSLFVSFVHLQILCSHFVCSEVYSAQVRLENLEQLQDDIVKAFDSYLKYEEIRLRGVRNQLESFRKKSGTDFKKIVNNPISSFRLVKKFTEGLDKLVKKADDHSNIDELLDTIDGLKASPNFPNQQDLTGAAVAITRVQDIYNLWAKDIASGCLLNNYCVRRLSAQELFTVAYLNYKDSKFEYAVQYFKEALKRYKKDFKFIELPVMNGTVLSEPLMLEYMAFSYYQNGDLTNATEVTKEILEVNPTHARARTNLDRYIKILDEEKTIKAEEDPSKLVIPISLDTWDEYKLLCRGENQTVIHNLKCRYRHGPHPYLRIRPVKEEMVHDKQSIWVFHDIISDADIKILQELAKNKLLRATVLNPNTGGYIPSDYRISQFYWFPPIYDVVISLEKRIKAITGLDMTTSENLQILNYGLGGQFEPHHDFFGNKIKRNQPNGDRVATFLLYMSNVEAGGATVFTKLGLTIYPIKGSAVFWYNLHPDGEGDSLTEHASCPVIIGSKWIANKWIHEREQEFIRPCGLKPSNSTTDQEVDNKNKEKRVIY